MTTLSLQQPLVGQPNSTEDPKIASDFSAIQTWANGNVDDSNLTSPNSAVRRLLLQATGIMVPTIVSGDYLLTGLSVVSSGGPTSTTPVPVWVGDAGYSSQPPDFQVVGKSAYCRVKMSTATNSVSPGLSIVGRLFQLTGVGGSSGQINYSFSAVAGSDTSSLTPTAGQVNIVEGAQFAMPSAGAFALGVHTGASLAPFAAMSVTVALLGYNA